MQRGWATARAGEKKVNVVDFYHNNQATITFHIDILSARYLLDQGLWACMYNIHIVFINIKAYKYQVFQF